VRSGDRGDLDRHIVDVVASDQRAGAVQPTSGLGLTEDGLAQQVDVQPDPRLVELRDGGTQTAIGRVDQQMPDHAAQHSPGHGDDDLRHHRPQPAADADAGLEVPGQERRCLRRELCQDAGCLYRVLGPHDPVHEARGEGGASWVAQEPGEQAGRALDLVPGCFGNPSADQRHDLPSEVEVFTQVEIGHQLPLPR